MNKLGKILIWAIGAPIILIILLVIIFYIWVYFASHLNLGRDKFDRDKWLANADDDRCYMYKNLIKNHLKEGMTMQEVENLLGDEVIIEYSVISLHKKALVYYGGGCIKNLLEGATARSMLIYLIFDKDEKLVKMYNNYDYTEYSSLFGVSCDLTRKTCDCYDSQSIKYKVPIDKVLNECGIEPW